MSSQSGDLFRALADPTRRRILDLLAERGTMTVGELATEFPELVASGISKHLMGLRTAGLVTATRQGRQRLYRIDQATMAGAMAPWLQKYERFWSAALGRLRDLAEAGAHGATQSVTLRSPAITIYSPDVMRLVRFYERIGFRETFRTPREGRPVHVELELDGFTLGLASVQAAEADHGLRLDLGGRPIEIVLWTDDTDGAYAELTAGGAPALSPPHEFLGGMLRAAWVADPDGNPMQLVQRHGTGRHGVPAYVPRPTT